jgi:hypothetical protein
MTLDGSRTDLLSPEKMSPLSRKKGSLFRSSGKGALTTCSSTHNIPAKLQSNHTYGCCNQLQHEAGINDGGPPHLQLACMCSHAH